MPVARRQLYVFAITLGVMASYLLVALFYTLPSNALSSRHSKGARQFFNDVTPQVWAFFTKNPEGVQIGAYAFDGKHSKNLLRTPQSNPSNFFGLSRTQRAQGPEMAIIDASVTDWKSCGGTLTTCLSQAAALPAAKITNRNPVQTICGDAFMTQEYVVPWSYRNLVPYDRRVTRIAHLDVSCP
jgi:antimicrobial peptide system SdpA family protein